MINPATFHFPRITFQGYEKRLFNPILKKSYKNLPEERVRLQFVEWLIEETGFSKTKISFESPVKLPRDKSRSRTDIICYDVDFSPLLLVECKAPDIRLDAKVALQIARYNQQVEAPLLAITNGRDCFWFRSGKQLSNLNEIPEPFQKSQHLMRDLNYWSARGFLGKNSDSVMHSWLTGASNELFQNKDFPPRYLSFDESDPKLLLSNYYRIFQFDETSQLALSFTAIPDGSSKMNAVINKSGNNIALLSTKTNSLFSDDTDTVFQSEKGVLELNLSKELNLNSDYTITDLISGLSHLMLT